MSFVVVVVVVVICASCAGYGVCKSFLAKLFLIVLLFLFIIVFPASQQIMDLTIFLNYVVLEHNCQVKQYSLVDIDTYCFEQELQ